MTDEIKTNMDDMKDFGEQVRLEGKIKGRKMKRQGLEKIVNVTGHELSTQEKVEGAKMVATDEMHSAGDKLHQVGLEVQMKARDAKTAIDQSAGKQKLDDAARVAGDKIEDAKDKLVDAFTPGQTVVTADGTTTTLPTDQQVQRDLNKEAIRTARDQEIEQERKRQQLVKDTKEKANEWKESAKEGIDRAEIVLGKVALAVKDKLDDWSDDQPGLTDEKLTEKGVDITSVQNKRNELLAAREARDAELAKARDPTLGEKLKHSLHRTVDKVNAAFIQHPDPVFVQKVSESGVDISHVENAENLALAKREEERVKADRLAATQREKAVIEKYVEKDMIDPTKRDLQQGEAQVVKQSDTLKTKMSALGESISRAAHKLGDNIKGVYQELAHPTENADLHEKYSSRGVDITSMENPRNEELGAEIRAQHTDELKETETVKTESTKDVIIKKTLDAGVATREAANTVADKTSVAAHEVADKTRHAANEVKYQSKIAAAEADIAATDLKEKSLELAESFKQGASSATTQAVDAMKDFSEAAGDKLHAAKEKIAPSSTDSFEKPELIRVQALPVLPTASPQTPDNFDSFQATRV